MIEERKRIEFWLDSGLGCCALKHREVGSYVQDSLLFGDPRRYRLIAWCVMPNHVHVLIDPLSSVSRIVQGWKSYTGRWALKQNERLELSIPDPDHFWMRDYWDRYIRNEEHLNNVIDYIHRNPVKAKLCRNPEDWAWSSAGMPLGAPTSPSAPQLQGPNK